MDPMKEPKEEPISDNVNEIALMDIKDEVMRDKEKVSDVTSGGMKEEVSSGIASKNSSHIDFKKEVVGDRGKSSSMPTGGAKRELYSGIANKRTSQTFGEALLGINNKSSSTVTDGARRGFPTGIANKKIAHVDIKNKVKRDNEKVTSVTTTSVKRKSSAIAKKTYSVGGIKIIPIQEKKVEKKDDYVGGIKSSMMMQKVIKSKIQPKRRVRKVEESEESSEEEYEDDWDSVEESDESEKEESDSEQPTFINPTKCEGTSVVKEKKNPSMLTLGAKFTEISKLVRHSKVSSNTADFSGITWKMDMQQFGDNGLIFSLNAECKSTVEWFCPVATELHFLTSESKKPIRKITRKKMLDREVTSASIGSLSREELFDTKKGLVEDDLITAAVRIKGYPRTLDQAREVALRAEFKDISKLTEEEVHSLPSVVDGVTWKMSVNKERFGYSIDLLAEKKGDTSWWCPVIADLHLVSQKTGDVIHIDKTQRYVYDAGHGFYRFATILKEDLFDDKKGFVKDDAIIVNILIRAFPIN